MSAQNIKTTTMEKELQRVMDVLFFSFSFLAVPDGVLPDDTMTMKELVGLIGAESNAWQ